MRLYRLRHSAVKLLDTLRLLARLGAARMLGRYVHSGWNGEIPFARYEWRGREWIIPTGPVDDEREEMLR